MEAEIEMLESRHRPIEFWRNASCDRRSFTRFGDQNRLEPFGHSAKQKLSEMDITSINFYNFHAFAFNNLFSQNAEYFWSVDPE